MPASFIDIALEAANSIETILLDSEFESLNELQITYNKEEMREHSKSYCLLRRQSHYICSVCRRCSYLHPHSQSETSSS